jgi:hypothetical protein
MEGVWQFARPKYPGGPGAAFVFPEYGSSLPTFTLPGAAQAPSGSSPIEVKDVRLICKQPCEYGGPLMLRLEAGFRTLAFEADGVHLSCSLCASELSLPLALDFASRC